MIEMVGCHHIGRRHENCDSRQANVVPQGQPSQVLYVANRLVEDVVIIGVQFLKARYFKPNLTLFDMMYGLEQPVSQRSAIEFRIPFNREREFCWIASVDGSLG